MSALAVVVEVEMSPAEARALTDRINATVDSVPALLLESHDRGAWRALAYPSWRKYATAEFHVSGAQAYYLLTQARTVAALSIAAGTVDVSNMLDKITIRTATDLRQSIDEAATEFGERIAGGEPPDEAIDAVIANHRAKPRPAKPKAPPDNVGDLRTLPKARSSTVLIERLAEQLGHYAHELAGLDLSTVEPDKAMLVADQLSQVRTTISRAIKELRGTA